MDWRLRQTEIVTDRNIKIHEKRNKQKIAKISKINNLKFIKYFKKRSLIDRLLRKSRFLYKISSIMTFNCPKNNVCYNLS